MKPMPRWLKSPIVSGLAVFVIVLLLTQWMSYQRYLIFKQSEQRELMNHANWTRERLQKVLSYSFSTTRTLAFIIDRYGLPKDFNKVAKELLKLNPYIDAVQLVKGEVISNVYPLKGNEEAIGLNILKDTLRSSGALTAIKTKQFFVAGPLHLIQGGEGIVARLPMFKANKFIGFTAVIIRLSTLYKDAGIDTTADRQYSYQLAKIDPVTGEEEFFLQQEASFDKKNFIPVEFSNGEWRLYVMARESKPLYAAGVFALLGIILSVVAGIFAWYIASQPAKLIQLVQEKTADVVQAQKQALIEKELSESIINSLPGIFYLYNDKGKFLRWNTNFEVVSGYTWDEVSKMHPLDFFEGTEKEILKQKIASVFINGQDEVEAEFIDKDGKKHPYYFNGWRIQYENQSCLIGVGIDITKRKKAEQITLQKMHEVNERVKELNCLYRVSEIANDSRASMESILEKVVEIIPSAYQYPEDACARIVFQEREFQSARFAASDWMQEVDISVGNIPVGVIEVYYASEKPSVYEGPFAKEERDLINTVAEILGNTAERKKAESELKKSYDDIRQLNAFLETVREEERTSIAREIHDELGQLLTGIKMDVSWFAKKIPPGDEVMTPRAEELNSMIDRTIKTVRRISSDLRPGILDDLGLVAALEWQASEFEKRTGISCKFESDFNELNVRKDVATGVFRVYQESLTNVMRHSQASLVESKLTRSNGWLLLNIWDNGKGFDIEKTHDKGTLGLLGMKERAAMMNGEIVIQSHQGKGAHILLKVPVEES